jgi:hypothetical protein
VYFFDRCRLKDIIHGFGEIKLIEMYCIFVIILRLDFDDLIRKSRLFGLTPEVEVNRRSVIRVDLLVDKVYNRLQQK